MEKSHWYDIFETGCLRYPKGWLTHYNGSKAYTLMVLSWDTEKDIANGWFPVLSRPTLAEARKASKEWFNG